MENARLEEITQQLRDEEEKLNAEAADLRGQLTGVEEDLKRVQGALKQLGEKPAKGQKAGKPGRGVPKNPAPTKEDVKTAIAEVRRELGELSAEKLQAEVEKRIVDAGMSRNGLALRFKEAMKDVGAQSHSTAEPSLA